VAGSVMAGGAAASADLGDRWVQFVGGGGGRDTGRGQSHIVHKAVPASMRRHTHNCPSNLSLQSRNNIKRLTDVRSRAFNDLTGVLGLEGEAKFLIT
jgi:hypothetical protein